MNAIVQQNNETMFGLSRLEAIFGKDREIRDYCGIQRLAVKTQAARVALGWKSVESHFNYLQTSLGHDAAKAKHITVLLL